MVEIISLQNGATLLLEQIEGFQSASVGFFVQAGSRYETPEQAGISHFVEHMLFKGTSRYSAGDLAGIMDAIGGRLTVERDSEQLLHNFYIVWLDKVTKLLDLTPAKTGSGGKQLFDAVGNMLGKAGRMLKERYKPEK